MNGFVAWLFEPLNRRLWRWMIRSGMVLQCSDAPDTSGINQAAVQSSALSKEALDWAKTIYAQEAPARGEAAALDKRVAESQVAGMDFATMQARQDAERNKTVFQPIENKLAADAQTYDTPERRAEAAARAGADVESAAGMAVADMNRDLLRRGGSVDDGGARGGALDLALGKARMRAGASDSAVRNVEQQGYARRMDAAGLGRGIVSNQATQQQIATQAGGAGVQAANAGLAATQSGTPGMQAGFAQGLQGMGQAGNLYGQAANIQSQARGQDFGLLGSAFNSFMMKPSSKKIKKNVKPTSPDAALAEVNELDVADYDYDPADGGPAGMGPQTGPMAEQTHAVMGARVAPGGKGIDMMQMGGKILAGMQALTKRVDRLEGVR